MLNLGLGSSKFVLVSSGGGGGGSESGFLIDDYSGAAAAYSVRRIASGATNLMRIREDSGDTETDIGYDSNGDLDTAAIATHCGSANGYVVTWYDQAGSNNATQSTLASQPQIYNGTAVITDNGKPALQYDGSDDFLSVPNDKTSFKFMHTGSFTTIETVARFGDSANPNAAYTLLDCGGLSSFDIGTGIFFDDRSSVPRNEAWCIQVSAGAGLPGAPVVSINNNECTPNEQKLIYMEIDADNATASNRCLSAIDAGTSFQKNSNTATPSTADNDRDLHIGRYSQSNALQLLGTMQELVLWDADHSASKSGIETNINSEYLIYQPTDTPTSGLLATYSGAAAAYSVRQLADTALISMTVRRDSDDEEQRFGFDENGDLDTAGIAAFCGSANGYVSQWWDQSTNGNHASQGTAASQPQIYNGTAVITENGKPALDFDGSNDFIFSGAITSSGDQTFSFVTKADTPSQHASSTGVFASSSQRALFTNGGPATYQSTQSGENDKVYGSYTASQMLHFVYHDNTTTANSFGRIDTVQDALDPSFNGKWDDVILGRYDATSGLNYNGNIQEFIFWTNNQSGNVTGIETDINDYYSIY